MVHLLVHASSSTHGAWAIHGAGREHEDATMWRVEIECILVVSNHVMYVKHFLKLLDVSLLNLLMLCLGRAQLVGRVVDHQ